MSVFDKVYVCNANKGMGKKRPASSISSSSSSSLPLRAKGAAAVATSSSGGISRGAPGEGLNVSNSTAASSLENVLSQMSERALLDALRCAAHERNALRRVLKKLDDELAKAEDEGVTTSASKERSKSADSEDIFESVLAGNDYEDDDGNKDGLGYP